MFHSWAVNGILVSLVVASVKERDSNWVNALVENIKDFNPYQTIIMLDDNQNRTLDVTKKIMAQLPSKVIHFNEVNVDDFRSSVAARSMHQISLFVAIMTEDTDPQLPLDFVMEVSKFYTHPRFLVIFPEGEDTNREDLLRFGWSKKLLDFSIIHFDNVAKIYYYNPFDDSYTEKLFTKDTTIFPEKLRDMKGFKMKAGGPRKEDKVYKFCTKIWPRMNNFNLKNNFKFIGRTSCFRNVNEDLMFDLAYNKINLISNEMTFGSKCKERFYTFAFNNNLRRTVALIPIKKSKNVFIFTKDSLKMGSVSCVLLLILWFILRFTKFDKDLWRSQQFIKMLLGQFVNHDTKRLSDRIAFVSVLIGFWLLSSELYTILTYTNLVEESAEVIESLVDLHESNLTISARNKFRDVWFRNAEEEVLHALFQKSMNLTNDEKCVKKLLRKKNNACIVPYKKAEYHIKNQLDDKQNPKMQIMREPLLISPGQVFFEINSPFVFEFERQWQKVVQSGLLLFKKKGENKLTMTIDLEKRDALFLRLIIVLIVGYGISILVFFGELILDCIQKYNSTVNKY